jgi:hypothetical protein
MTKEGKNVGRGQRAMAKEREHNDQGDMIREHR